MMRWWLIVISTLVWAPAARAATNSTSNSTACLAVPTVACTALLTSRINQSYTNVTLNTTQKSAAVQRAIDDFLVKCLNTAPSGLRPINILTVPQYTAINNIVLTQLNSDVGYTAKTTVLSSSALFKEISSDAAKNLTALYDVVIYSNKYIPDFGRLGVFTDLTPLVTSDPVINWADFTQYYRDAAGYGGKIVGLPLVGVTYSLFYRRDILLANNITQPPYTWEDVATLAERFNGTDFNNDGVPDWSVCHSLAASCQAPHILLDIVTNILQYKGPTQGCLFDPYTMKPLVDNPALALAMQIYRRLAAVNPMYVSNYTVSDNNCAGGTNSFLNGTCLFVVANSQVFKGETGSPWMKGKIGSAIVPGFAQVLDRDTNQLVLCDQQRCPYAVQRTLLNGSTAWVNYAPWKGTVGYSGSVVSDVGPDYRAAAFSYLSQAVAPELLWQETLDNTSFNAPLRASAIVGSDAYNRFLKEGYDPQDTADWLAVTKATLNTENAVMAAGLPNPDGFQGLYEAAALNLTYRSPFPGDAANATGWSAPISYIQQQLNDQLSALLAQTGPLPQMRAFYWDSIGLKASTAPPPAGFTPNSSDGGSAPASTGSSKTLQGPMLAAVIIPPVVGVLGLALVGWVMMSKLLREHKRSLTGKVKPPGPGPETTLLLTDLEGSTTLFEEVDPEIMDEAMSLHHQLIREMCRKHSGYEWSTEGDSFLLAFHMPQDAVLFAADVQAGLMQCPWPETLLQHPLASCVWATPLTGKKTGTNMSRGNALGLPSPRREGGMLARFTSRSPGPANVSPAPSGLLVESTASMSRGDSFRLPILSGWLKGRGGVSPAPATLSMGIKHHLRASYDMPPISPAGFLPTSTDSYVALTGTPSASGVLPVPAALGTLSAELKQQLSDASVPQLVLPPMPARQSKFGGSNRSSDQGAHPSPTQTSSMVVQNDAGAVNHNHQHAASPTRSHALGASAAHQATDISNAGSMGFVALTAGHTDRRSPFSQYSNPLLGGSSVDTSQHQLQEVRVEDVQVGSLDLVRAKSRVSPTGNSMDLPQTRSGRLNFNSLMTMIGLRGGSGSIANNVSRAPSMSQTIGSKDAHGSLAIMDTNSNMYSGMYASTAPDRFGSNTGPQPRTVLEQLKLTTQFVMGPGVEPGKVLLFRGPRVRVGMHSGVMNNADVNYNRSAGRVQYSGPALQMARAVQGAACGGMTLISEATMELLPVESLQDRLMVGHEGEYLLNLSYKPPSKSQALSALPSFKPPGPRQSTRNTTRGTRQSMLMPVRAHTVPTDSASAAVTAGDAEKDKAAGGSDDGLPINLYGVLPQLLVLRAPVMAGRIRSLGCWSKGYLAAPFGTATICFMHVVGLTSLREWNAEVTSEAVALWHDLACTALSALGGYLLETNADGLLLAAFTQPTQAIRWALGVVADCLELDWPAALLEHELGEEVAVHHHFAPDLSGGSQHLYGLRASVSVNPPSPRHKSPASLAVAAARASEQLGSPVEAPPASSPRASNPAPDTLPPLPSGQRLGTSGRFPSVRINEQPVQPQAANRRKSSLVLYAPVMGEIASSPTSSQGGRPSSVFAGWDAQKQVDGGGAADVEASAISAVKERARLNRTLLFRGLRLKCGIDCGPVAGDLHATTGRITYRGRCMNRASRIAGATKTGQVWASEDVWAEACTSINDLIQGFGLSGVSDNDTDDAQKLLAQQAAITEHGHTKQTVNGAQLAPQKLKGIPEEVRMYALSLNTPEGSMMSMLPVKNSVAAGSQRYSSMSRRRMSRRTSSHQTE